MSENPFMFSGSLAEVDPEIRMLSDVEADRQRKKLIFIASESICPRPVREAQMTTFSNLYAEGYPALRMYEEERDELMDFARQLAFQRRYADRRYYKGTEFANFVEALAIRRAAKLFASDHTPAEAIHVNVQPMSGAMANNAVYEAFCEPGDTVMGMELTFGGHLTHGSDANRSGKRYRMVSYQPDRSGQLDYDAMKKVAIAEKPKLIIAGYSAYPWAIDWREMREVADSVGAILLADIAHPAGLVVAGLFPNPVGIVDVTTLTTHKTLCGPRGAIMLTTNPDCAELIDAAVFPGEQGGPHINTIAAKAVSFALAATDEFKELQKNVLDNAQSMAESFRKRGIEIGYGGTNSHLFLIDLRAVKTQTGKPITGEIASRLLDMVNITVNKNTIGGDENAAHPSAVRFGMTWATQRGLGPEELDRVAEWSTKLLTSAHSYSYIEATGDAGRGKLDMDLLEEVKAEVGEFIKQFPDGQDVEGSSEREGYPYWYCADEAATPTDAGGPGTIEVSGERATAFLNELSTADVQSMDEGETRQTFFLDRNGSLICRAVVARAEGPSPVRRRYIVVCPGENAGRLILWMRSVSDGYVLFDSDDIYRKVQGPVVVNNLSDGSDGAADGTDTKEIISKALSAMKETGSVTSGEQMPASGLLKKHPEQFDLIKPYFVGTAHVKRSPEHAKGKKQYKYEPKEEPAIRTCLYEEHLKLGKPRMAAFAGHEMPVWYTSIIDEHRAVRETAGLFDVSHMGVLDVRGRDACRFMDMVSSNYIVRLRPGQSIYGYLFYPDGTCVDDVLTYCISYEHYMVVFNAANIRKDLDWLSAVNTGEIIIDESRPWITPPKVEIRYLKDESHGEDMRVDVALQGPASLPTVLKLASGDRILQGRIRGIKRTEFIDCELAGLPLLLSRTGYTGEQIGYEFYIHPEQAPELWNRVLEAGEEFGVKPTGLGARDSTRTEVGLPLFGHELEGESKVNPIEAGYGPFVKLHKPFFIGRDHAVEMAENREREVCRFKTTGGMRKVNPGDAVVNVRGNQFIGNVTSCVFVDESTQVGMAAVQRRYNVEGWEIALVAKPRGKTRGFDDLTVGDKFPLAQAGIVLERFPDQNEKESE